MSRLSEARRWENETKTPQKIMNTRQGTYVTVSPGAYVEGSQYADTVKNLPWFKETLQHLTQPEIYELVQEESDVPLLQKLANVERAAKRPRDGIVKIFDARVRALLENNKTMGATK